MSELAEYEEQDSYFSDWFSENKEELEIEFLAKKTWDLTDDKIAEFMENNYDEFMAYCKKQFALEN